MVTPTSPSSSSQHAKTLGPATAAALTKLEARIFQAEVSTGDLRKSHNSVSNSLQKFRDFQTLQGERIGLLENVWEKVDALKVGLLIKRALFFLVIIVPLFFPST